MKILIISLILCLNFGNASAKDVEKAIYEIYSGAEDNFKFNKTGSSVLIEVNKNKYLMTNFHVCSNDSFNMALVGDKIPFGIRNYKTKARVSFFVSSKDIIFDDKEDICLIPVSNILSLFKVQTLKIAKNEKYKTLKIATPFNGNKIQKIAVLGLDNPEENFIPKENGYRIDFPIQSGMSGSPILNERNEVVMLVWGRQEEKDKVIGLSIGLKSILALIKKNKV